ncbi:MAG: HAD family hydrolase [Promethearchaeota archaeon]
MAISRIPISAIIFDAGDVLVHKIPNYQVQAWKEFSSLFDDSTIDKEDYFNQIYERVRILGSYSKSEYISLYSVKPKIKISLFEEFEIQKWWKNPDPNLNEIISKLWRIGYQIGILTDSALPSTIIRKVFSQISPYIHQIVSSRDVGVMKPHEQMFSTMLSNLEIPPNRALFIAHDPVEINGALKSGLLCENFELIGNLNNLLELIQEKYILI